MALAGAEQPELRQEELQQQESQDLGARQSTAAAGTDIDSNIKDVKDPHHSTIPQDIKCLAESQQQESPDQGAVYVAAAPSASATKEDVDVNVKSNENPCPSPSPNCPSSLETQHIQSSSQDPERYESKHVHAVYEQIATHFSSTRYKPWPIVDSFLTSLSPGSIGLDIGCGNGKYLIVNRDIFIIGSDRSSNLTSIATQHQPHSAIVADNLSLPHQNGRFDFAISIAVVHHLSTPERRKGAIGAILDCLKEGGKALIYVWALEQKNSRRGWDEGHEQDVMVPWVMKTGKKVNEKGEKVEASEKTFQRYYHLYRSGELEENIVAVGGRVFESGYEKDNWWAIATVENTRQ